MNELLIDTQLPSLNEYVLKCRSHWSKGAEFKKQVENTIGWYIKFSRMKGKLKPVKNQCEIYIEWHEATRRRDVDNIQSAQKFILDALQRFDILKDDSRKYVSQIHHTVIDDEKDFVIVRFEENEN